ncbi:MAG: YggS family pyridoxal phosphate-dependent enzyme [Gammaproteobacteria bacterium]|nr:YggS family pyridoxal phosphate-dependent enzyme [Gammaproteobacteria bacterium]
MNPDAERIREKLESTRLEIARHATEFGREPTGISLLAVSKTKPAELVLAALDAGQSSFGENYLQDALPKIESLDGNGIEWHFIGAIQSNKTRDIAAHFDWVQTVDRAKIIRRLDEQRGDELPPLNVLLQVNVDDESQKAGASPEEIDPLADAVAESPRLRLRGLMAIPQHSDDFETQRTSFRRLRDCFESLRERHPEIDTLSMGMSGDMRAAIAEGSTMLRIGTAIFGPRD